MFFKTIRGKGPEKIEFLVECERVMTHIKPDDHEVLLFTLEATAKGQKTVEVEVDKREPDVAVFIMNESGKTIDTPFYNRY